MSDIRFIEQFINAVSWMCLCRFDYHGCLCGTVWL